MIVDVNAGWKAHSLLRHSTKTQNTGNFEEANRFIALVREYTNRDALIRHRMQKESILSGALHCAVLHASKLGSCMSHWPDLEYLLSLSFTSPCCFPTSTWETQSRIFSTLFSASWDCRASHLLFISFRLWDMLSWNDVVAWSLQIWSAFLTASKVLVQSSNLIMLRRWFVTVWREK